MKIKEQQYGYAAIASILVISAVVLIIATSVLLLSINDMQSSLANKKGEQSLGLVEGCVEEALMYLNKNNTIPSSIILPEITCSVTIISQGGGVWTFTVAGNVETYSKKIKVNASRGANVSVSEWVAL